MNYEQTIEFLFRSLPEFQRIGAAAYKAGLGTSMALDDYFGNPHLAFSSIHIGGTNGKGSTSQMIYESLRRAGFSVGLYTSPHLLDFRERIVVDGQMISQQAVIDFTAKLLEFKSVKPSFFEMTVAMAFDYFRNMNVDYAVIEVGMGGRLDSTNIVTPQLSVITNISLDHVQFLGNTIAAIAGEKAGIIKAGVPVVIGQSQAECRAVFERKASQMDAPIIWADKELKGQHYATSMQGRYQQKNSITAAAALHILGIEERFIVDGIKNATVRGRWQVLYNTPLTVCDTGHNEDGLRYVAAQIAQQRYERLYFVIGVVSDKDVEHIFPLLPPHAHYIFTQPSVERAMDASSLAERAAAAGLKGEVATTVELAYNRAKELATPSDMIFIGGSTFTVADILKIV